MKKFLIVICALFLLSACGKQENVQTNDGKVGEIGDISNFIPGVETIAENNQSKIINKYINLENNTVYDLSQELFKQKNINDIAGSRKSMSNYQYYKDRMIIGCESCGGTSYVAKIEKNNQIDIQKIDKNILDFDENDRTYTIQSETGYEMVDETFSTVQETIPLPTDLETLSRGTIYFYDKKHIYYFGEQNNEAYVVLQYNTEVKEWQLITKLLNYGIEVQGFGDISYNKKYPDWISISINQLYDTKNEEIITLNRTYFINTITNEVKEYDLLTHRSPFFSNNNSNYSIAVDNDQLTILDPNPEGPQIIDKYLIEDMNQEGDAHINGLIQYIEEDRVIVFVPDGYLKYDIKSKHGEYILKFQPYIE